jgi:hypothetical protein
MKKLFTFLSVLAVLGAGCGGSPTPPPAPPAPQASYVGCTPKAAVVASPLPGASASLPLPITLKVENRSQPNCHWIVFEAVAGSARLLDKDGIVVGTTQLNTTEDWMTDGPVNFYGTIPALALVEGPATLVITEENPSGEGTPQEISIPLVIQR